MDRRMITRQFVEGLLRKKGDLDPFGDSESLILSGRLESIDAVEIVMFIENQFGVDFSAVGFDQGLIDSIELIVRLVQGHAPA